MNVPAAPRVAVVILTWNRVDDLVGCLESFACVDYPNYEVIVVDNGSKDDTVAVARARFPWATLIENGENLGYCKGNNAGIRHALARGADHVMILNSDTKCTPTLLSELVRVLESDPRIGIVGAKNLLMENPDVTWGKYGKVTWGPLLVRSEGRLLLDDRLNEDPRDVDWVIGNACMMRREALERIGLFDEEFWQTNEDADWCYRARAAGYRVVYVDRAAVLHIGGSSANPTYDTIFSYNYFMGRNAFVFARKHGSLAQRLRLLVAMCVGVAGRLALLNAHNLAHAVRGQRSFVRGMLDGMRGRLSPEEITVKIHPGSKPFEKGLAAWLARFFGV